MPQVEELTIDATNSTERPREHREPPKDIQGWGADRDLRMRPAYPKERIPQRLAVPWKHPEHQEIDREVLLSVEYPQMRPVFGTSIPPAGVSGAIRRAAFRLSESDIRHWLLLLFADRVNVVEGIIDDLAQGYMPNIFAEMGWKAKFKHDRAAAIGKSLLIAGAMGYVGYRLLRRRRD
jgi:hypothetical protein